MRYYTAIGAFYQISVFSYLHSACLSRKYFNPSSLVLGYLNFSVIFSSLTVIALYSCFECGMTYIILSYWFSNIFLHSSDMSSLLFFHASLISTILSGSYFIRSSIETPYVFICIAGHEKSISSGRSISMNCSSPIE